MEIVNGMVHFIKYIVHILRCMFRLSKLCLYFYENLTSLIYTISSKCYTF